MPPPPRDPITVALVDDYDVVVKGVANMLDPYRDRIVIAELDSSMPVKDTVDIVLYDSFALARRSTSSTEVSLLLTLASFSQVERVWPPSDRLDGGGIRGRQRELHARHVEHTQRRIDPFVESRRRDKL